MAGQSSGTREVVASHYQGRELNSPNDIRVKSDGATYFTDPWYGRMPVFGVERDLPPLNVATFRARISGWCNPREGNRCH
ncbi:MAG: hypothetical protein FJ286_17830, partial [Planctomycetes bacterium]|nr:hypothetical protein [Planctomycetota bacterium]